MQPPFDFYSGEKLLIHKPRGWTSFDVVNKIKHLLKKILPPQEDKKLRIGHAGTLDPLATGLLIICTGMKTKEIERIQAAEKEYTGSFFMGATTASFDLETEPENFTDISRLTPEIIFNTARAFTGDILQVPPAHSAVKVGGQRAYKRARKGHAVALSPRTVTVSDFEITGIELPLVHFRIACSKGTYIRSLAHDFGKKAGTGAYLHSLCRTRIGSFRLEDALSIVEFENRLNHILNHHTC
jgi:tRNA pseudouridine55 synthase